MDLVGAAPRWVVGGGINALLPKTCYTYPTIMKLVTVVPCLKMIHKLDQSYETLLEFFSHQHFPAEINNFRYIGK